MVGLRELNAHPTWPMRRMPGKPVRICPLTHGRNVLDDANECVKNNPRGDVALVDGMPRLTAWGV